MALTYSLINEGTEYEVSKYEGSDVTVRIPETYEGKRVTSIGDWAFAHSSIYNIILSNKIKTIGERAFYNCINLNNIIIPTSTTTIKNYAFYGCTKFTHVFIPKSVTTLGDQIFTGCPNISICCETESMPARWSNLWNSAGYPVIWGISKLECLIDFDDEWIQDGCHWKYDRIFTITWKITGEVAQKEFYYRLGPYVDDYTKYTRVFESNEKLYKNGNTWTYELRLSSIDTEKLLATRTNEGWLPITAYLKITDTINNVHTTYYTYDYYLELPPVFESNTIKYDLVVDNPGKIKVSWTSADELDGSDAENSPDSLDGYSIEVFHCPANLDATIAENFTRLDGLQWKDADPETGMPTTGVYKLTRVPVNIEITTPEVLEGEEEISSYANLNPSGEVYIEKPLKTEFFFNPKHLDIKPGDSYKFVIYPYSHYEGSLISSQGVESSVKKVSKGVVRVRTSSGWVEGQVWVCTETAEGLKWVQAESIYTKIGAGWQEAI